MNYGQIIKQAWQIIRRTPIIWFVGLITLFLPFLLIKTSNNFGLACLYLVLLILYSVIGFFITFTITVSAEKVLQGDTPKLKGIWAAFKTFFWRIIALNLMYAIPIILTVLCVVLIQGLISTLSGSLIINLQSRIFWAAIFIAVFGLGLFYLCYYGLIFHEMEVFKSIQHGIHVFAMNWFKCLILAAIIQSPRYLLYLMEWFILSARNPSALSAGFSLSIINFPFNLVNAVVSVPITLFISVSFLLAYHQFIQEYDYPTLRPPSFTV